MMHIPRNITDLYSYFDIPPFFQKKKSSVLDRNMHLTLVLYTAGENVILYERRTLKRKLAQEQEENVDRQRDLLYDLLHLPIFVC